jgi:hypothetical protein
MSWIIIIALLPITASGFGTYYSIDSFFDKRKKKQHKLRKWRIVICTTIGWIGSATIIIYGANNSVALIEPQLEMPTSARYQNPRITENRSSDGDTIYIYFFVTSLTDGIAYNIRSRVVILNTDEDSLKLWKANLERGFNRDMVVYKGGETTARSYFIGKQLFPESSFICFEFSYCDKNGNEQTPLRKIYKCSRNTMGQQLHEVGKEYDKIVLFLQNNKLW